MKKENVNKAKQSKINKKLNTKIKNDSLQHLLIVSYQCLSTPKAIIMASTHLGPYVSCELQQHSRAEVHMNIPTRIFSAEHIMILKEHIRSI